MIGQRFHGKIGWIFTITSSIKCKHGVFDMAVFRENMGCIIEDQECSILKI